MYSICAVRGTRGRLPATRQPELDLRGKICIYSLLNLDTNMRQSRIHLSSPEKSSNRSSSLFTRSDSPSSTGSYSDIALAFDPKYVRAQLLPSMPPTSIQACPVQSTIRRPWCLRDGYQGPQQGHARDPHQIGRTRTGRH